MRYFSQTKSLLPANLVLLESLCVVDLALDSMNREISPHWSTLTASPDLELRLLVVHHKLTRHLQEAITNDVNDGSGDCGNGCWEDLTSTSTFYLCSGSLTVTSALPLAGLQHPSLDLLIALGNLLSFTLIVGLLGSDVENWLNSVNREGTLKRTYYTTRCEGD